MNTHSLCLALAADSPPTWLAWLADVQDFAPEMFGPCEVCDRPESPTDAAVSIAQSCENLRAADALSNWQSIYSTGAAIAKNAGTTDRDHGDVNPYRAAVDTLLREYDRDPQVVGIRLPDPLEGSRHTTVPRRSRKGRTYNEPKRRGVAPVQGRTVLEHIESTGSAAARHGMATHLLTYARRLRLGVNSLDVTRITQACYGDLLDPCTVGVDRDGTDRITTLLGTDWQAWQQVIDPAAVPADTALPASVGYAVLTRSVEGGKSETVWAPSTPAADAAPTPVLIPIEGTTYDNGKVTWQAHATCSHTDQTRRRATLRRNLKRVQPRKAELPDLEPITLPDGTVLTRLLAPADRPDAAWLGHTLTPRKAKATRKGPRNVKRTQSRARARQAADQAVPRFAITSEQGWAEWLAALRPGESQAVTSGDYRVRVSLSPSAHKHNVRVLTASHTEHPGRVVLNLQVRNRATLARRLAASTI